METSQLRSATRHTGALLIGTASAMFYVLIFAGVASAKSGDGTLRLTVSAPQGVPATVVANGDGRVYFAKGPSGKSATSSRLVPTGTKRLVAKRFTFDGHVYAATLSKRSIVVRKGKVASVKVKFKSLKLADQLITTAITRTSVSLRWTPSGKAQVKLRRTVGERPASFASGGKNIAISGTSAKDSGLASGATFTYALFTKVGRRWVGPVVVSVGTTSSDPRVATFVAPPSTVIVKPGDPDVPTLISGGVRVKLAPKRATPLLGGGFVLPVSELLPGGYLGKVVGISPDGRTVQLIGAGIAEAFDYYDINVDLSTLGSSTLEAMTAKASGKSRPTASTGISAGLGRCSVSGGQSVNIRPTIAPSGRFSSHVEKGWSSFKPTLKGVFDLRTELKIGVAMDVETSASVACGLDIKKFVKQITVVPVPIAIVFDPAVEISINGSLTTSNFGYTVTAGFWVKGSVGTSNSIDGGLIANGGPTASNTFFALNVGLSLGGELTVGPGGGLPDIGTVAGVGGTIYPLKATFGPVFPASDPRRELCIRTTAFMESQLNVNAKAWAGPLDASVNYSIDALKATANYGGPWYFPYDCELIMVVQSSLLPKLSSEKKTY